MKAASDLLIDNSVSSKSCQAYDQSKINIL